MRLHTKIVDEELAKLGFQATLVKAKGYYYFDGPAAADWLDRTVRLRKINDLTLKQWIEEFRRLKELNERIIKSAKPRPAK